MNEAALIIDGKLGANIVLTLSRPFDIDPDPHYPHVRAAAEIEASFFRARFNHNVGIREIRQFRAEMAKLYSDLTGEARYESLETDLCLWVRGDGLGHMLLTGEASDHDAGNKPTFNFEFDQTQIPQILNTLDVWIEQLLATGLLKE